MLLGVHLLASSSTSSSIWGVGKRKASIGSCLASFRTCAHLWLTYSTPVCSLGRTICSVCQSFHLPLLLTLDTTNKAAFSPTDHLLSRTTSDVASFWPTQWSFEGCFNQRSNSIDSTSNSTACGSINTRLFSSLSCLSGLSSHARVARVLFAAQPLDPASRWSGCRSNSRHSCRFFNVRPAIQFWSYQMIGSLRLLQESAADATSVRDRPRVVRAKKARERSRTCRRGARCTVVTIDIDPSAFRQKYKI